MLRGMKVVLATGNPGKVRELKEGLAPLGWTLLTLADFALRMPKEEGATFLENALLKAAYVAKATGLPALADDSGPEVYALGGEPGVYSARYGGGPRTGSGTSTSWRGCATSKGRSARPASWPSWSWPTPTGTPRPTRGAEGVILEAPRGEGASATIPSSTSLRRGRPSPRWA